MKLQNQIYSKYSDVDFSKTKGSFGSRNPLLKRIHQHLKITNETQVLDIGCGLGENLVMLKKRGCTALKGVDVSESQVDFCCSLDLDVECCDGVQYLKRSDKQYDLIFSLDVLEHLDQSQIYEMVKEIKKRLRSGGRWILRLPNGDSPFHGAIRYGDTTHYTCFTHSSLHQLLSSFDLSIEAISESIVFRRTIVGFIRYIIWKLVRSLLIAWTFSETGELNFKKPYTRNLICVVSN